MSNDEQTIEGLVSRAKALPKKTGLDVTLDDLKLLYRQGGELTVQNRQMRGEPAGHIYQFQQVTYEGCKFRTLTTEKVDFSQW